MSTVELRTLAVHYITQLHIDCHNYVWAALITAYIWQAKLVKNRKNAKNKSTLEKYFRFLNSTSGPQIDVEPMGKPVSPLNHKFRPA